MTLTLLGSASSPYVRRLRLYLQDFPHEFQAINIFDPQDDARLTAISPIKRIPLLLTDGNPLFESRVIFHYLQTKFGKHSLTLDEENLVSAIDAIQDQLIQQYLMKRFGHPVDMSNGYFRRAETRKKEILAFLDTAVKRDGFLRWDYPAMSLYSLVDWASFREMLSREEIPASLFKFLKDYAGQGGVAATDPRLA
jgi:glutathione S-transferase